jgi:hypothetical protein
MNILMSLQAIYHFKIATAFSLEEHISYEELARRCNVDEDQLRRLMRMAISNNIFNEPQKGFITHSAVSRLIAEEKLVYQWIGLVSEELWPASCKTVPAMIHWPGSQEPAETGFALANENIESFWDAIRKNPHRAQRFVDGIRFLQTHPAFTVDYLVDSLQWDETCPETMVDIGGSEGSISVALLRRYPNLTCHVQDLPVVVNNVVPPAELQGRIHFSAHDFFTPQTIHGADVYFLRSILHDWSDKYAVQIIRNLIPALKAGAKVIVNEVCLPEPNRLANYHEQLLRGYDLSMQQNFNSKERDAEQWESLFRAASPRFRLRGIDCPVGSILAVIEFAWQPGEVFN